MIYIKTFKFLSICLFFIQSCINTDKNKNIKKPKWITKLIGHFKKTSIKKNIKNKSKKSENDDLNLINKELEDILVDLKKMIIDTEKLKYNTLRLQKKAEILKTQKNQRKIKILKVFLSIPFIESYLKYKYNYSIFIPKYKFLENSLKDVKSILHFDLINIILSYYVDLELSDYSKVSFQTVCSLELNNLKQNMDSLKNFDFHKYNFSYVDSYHKKTLFYVEQGYCFIYSNEFRWIYDKNNQYSKEFKIIVNGLEIPNLNLYKEDLVIALSSNLLLESKSIIDLNT